MHTEVKARAIAAVMTGRPSSKPILELLQRAYRICVEKKDLDPARLYVWIVRGEGRRGDETE